MSLRNLQRTCSAEESKKEQQTRVVYFHSELIANYVCVCVGACVRACVRASVRARARVSVCYVCLLVGGCWRGSRV